MTLIPSKVQIIIILSFVTFVGYIFARHLSLDFEASDLNKIYDSGYTNVSIVSKKRVVNLNEPKIKKVIKLVSSMESKWFVDPKGSEHICSLNFSKPTSSEIHSIQFYQKGSAIITKAAVVNDYSQYYFEFYYGDSLYKLLSKYAPNICVK